jgi:Fe-S cluster biogenesis protein NfuA
MSESTNTTTSADGIAPVGADLGVVPVEAAGPVVAVEVLSDEVREERMKALRSVVELIRPVVQQDGGDLALHAADVETGIVEVRLQGSCSSCAVSSTTLQAGVNRILKDRLPWVTEVIGGVEEMDYETSKSMGMGGYVPKHEMA